jgi:hypothetical protein
MMRAVHCITGLRVAAILLVVAFAGLGTPLATAQEAQGEEQEPTSAPTGFSDIRLGANMQEVKASLEESTYFTYRGDPDVSLLPTADRSVIESEGRSFIDRGFFQFSDEALYIIILQLNQNRMDHYSVYLQLTDTYGDPASVSPQEIAWEWDNVRLSLERPLTVKYVDRVVFESLREEAQVERSLREVARDRFLEDL